MSDFNWCHGPKCHEKKTQDRVRGTKGSKVLRTRKITLNSWNRDNQFSHFCSQGCWNDFAFAHWEEFIGLHARPQALETPIEDPKKTTTTYNHGWGDCTYTTTEITKIDNPS